jgi:hypothetical protein
MIFVCLFGCNDDKRKLVDNSIQTKDKNNSNIEENNNLIPFELKDRKIIISPDDDIIIKNNLDEIFIENDYIILEEPLKTGKHNIWFAIHYIKNNPEIFNFAIGYEVLDGIFHRYIMYKDFTFFNEDNSVLLEFLPEKYQGIYGFDFSYSYPKVEGYTPGLVVSGYFDEGKRVADDFSIEWDEDKKQFRKRVFNINY